MKKNVIFVFVFAAIIVGLVQLHTYSQTESADAADNVAVNITDIKDIARISYPSAIEERNDIPFKKLIDPEVLKSIADTVDVEKYRPAKIFLAKGFDADDAAQLKYFSNIVVNANAIEGFDSETLTEDAATEIAESVKSSVEHNVLQSYTISDWEVAPMEEFSGNKILRYQYKQTNNEGRATYLILTYIFKGNKQIEVQMSATEKDYPQWQTINNEVVKNIEIK